PSLSPLFPYTTLFRSGSPAASVQEPGLSFFDRDDQANLIKLHLPYIWRTPEAVDTLFLPLLNRPAPKLEVKCGVVETDWYASPRSEEHTSELQSPCNL